jgi:NIMA (never in mitosis gene a)-related kinase
MSKMDSQYVVKYFDSFISNSKKVNIVMEYCEHGDLHKLLKKRKDPSELGKHKYLSENRVWSFFIQICIGLHHMHSQKILHRDLKTLNIFLTKENKIKIGDLGVAKIMDNFENFATSKVGTPYYLSPEVCEDRPYNSKSDIWSLGCILYEMCTLRHPFEAKN